MMKLLKKIIRYLFQDDDKLDRMSYVNYLRSPEWSAIRKRKLKQGRYRCFRCWNKDRLDVHHLRYPKRGKERMNDLRLLCRSCHRKVHNKC